MMAWWYDGVLQNLSLIHLPGDEKRAVALQEQLAQTTWAAELEGWLTSEPRFHLVADQATTARWIPLFDLGRPVKVVPPLAPQELAALTARRVATNGTATNLLPPEYATRYKQQFIDRLWMRGLGALLMCYIGGVVIYFGFVQYASFRHSSVQNQVASLGPTYTNTVQLRERLRVLRDTLELQYAALECYKSVAETLPSELTLNNISFERGRRVTFFGTAATDDRTKVLEFNAKLMEYLVKNQPFYAKVNSPIMNTDAGRILLTWNFSCDLNRSDATE